jgi:hypothetical protein
MNDDEVILERHITLRTIPAKSLKDSGKEGRVNVHISMILQYGMRKAIPSYGQRKNKFQGDSTAASLK